MPLPQTSEYQSAIDYLYQRVNFERSLPKNYSDQEYKLARMTSLLELLGNPQLKQPVVHIAGTKGKGSVAWFIAETMRHAGYKVGLYTSPHLIDIRERFVIDGSPCSKSDLIAAAKQLQKIEPKLQTHETGEPTFFEMTTAIAWLMFAQSNTDIAIIEVGMGGRLDSTNVCDPNLCVITSISLDHQKYLGSTIAAIAAEKGGIIKSNVPVINGAGSQEARSVIREIAGSCDATNIEQSVNFNHRWLPPDDQSNVGSFEFEISLPPQSTDVTTDARPTRSGTVQWPLLPLGMLGRHQSNNAAIAAAAVETLRNQSWHIPDQAIADAFLKTQIAARIEIVQDDPIIIVDTAHNGVSVDALITTLDSHFSPQKRIAVFASSCDKDFLEMMRRSVDYFDRIILTEYTSSFRAASVNDLKQAAELAGYPSDCIHQSTSSKQAIGLVQSMANSDDLICFFGSFYLAAEILPILKTNKDEQG